MTTVIPENSAKGDDVKAFDDGSTSKGAGVARDDGDPSTSKRALRRNSSVASMKRGLQQPAYPLKSFSIALLVLTVLLILFYFLFMDYSSDEFGADMAENYTWFLHVSIMIFIGFGYLMTFLRRFTLGAVALNFIASVAVMLEAMLILGAMWQSEHADFSQGLRFIKLDMTLLASGLFAAAVGMITFGVVIGKVGPSQLLFILVLQVPIWAINLILIFEHQFVPMGAEDAGGAITIHVFGAYYGLAAAWMVYRKREELGGDHEKNSASHESNLTSLVGTVFLWIFWPSFNAFLTGPLRNVAVMNTVISISGSTMATFVLSPFLTPGGKIDMSHVQNATLAGGVSMGAIPHLAIGPGAALLVGFFGGCLSCVGFTHIGPFLEARISLRDTCGVHSLHGMPGVYAGVVGIITLAAMGPPGAAVAELLTLLVSLVVAIGGGLAVGAASMFIDAEPSTEKRAILAFEDASYFDSVPPEP